MISSEILFPADVIASGGDESCFLNEILQKHRFPLDVRTKQKRKERKGKERIIEVNVNEPVSKC